MDLSRLLGDLYDDGDDRPENEAPASPLATGEGPEWADESRLDAAFASWTPGPPSDAPAAEQDMARVDTPGPQLVPQAPPDEARSPERSEEGAPTEASPPAAERRRWTRSDDDVLPQRRRRGGLGLSLLRR